MSKLPALKTAPLKGFTPLEAYFFQRAGVDSTPAAGTALDADALHLVLTGSVKHGEKTIAAGGCVNPDVLFGQTDAVTPVAGADTRLLTLTCEKLAALCDRYPRLGMKLYQNLAAYRNG